MEEEWRVDMALDFRVYRARLGRIELQEIEWLRVGVRIDSERFWGFGHDRGGRHSSLVVEISFAMSTLVITPCLADANSGAVCYHRPLSQQIRGLCLGSTSPQQLSTCANPLRSSPLGLGRGFFRTRRSLQGGPRADSETEERPSRAEGNGRGGGLDELDNQLRSLSSSDNLMSAAREASEGNVEELPREESKKVDWPVFGDGFMLYISVGLVLLTIINNLLFRLFIGPSVPRVPLTQVTEQTPLSEGAQEFRAQEVRRERYKLRSYNDPKYFQNIAPPVTDEPVS